jgi:hypothetical protein
VIAKIRNDINNNFTMAIMNNHARNTSVAASSNATLPSVIPSMPSPDRVMITFSVNDITIAPITSNTVDGSYIIPHVAQFYTFTSHPWNDEQNRFDIFVMTLQDIVAHSKWKLIKDAASTSTWKKKSNKKYFKKCLKKFIAP